MKRLAILAAVVAAIHASPARADISCSSWAEAAGTPLADMFKGYAWGTAEAWGWSLMSDARKKGNVYGDQPGQYNVAKVVQFVNAHCLVSPDGFVGTGVFKLTTKLVDLAPEPAPAATGKKEKSL